MAAIYLLEAGSDAVPTCVEMKLQWLEVISGVCLLRSPNTEFVVSIIWVHHYFEQCRRVFPDDRDSDRHPPRCKGMHT